MLSAGNLAALKDAGYDFIVEVKNTEAERHIASHLATHANYFKDGQKVEATQVMGQGSQARIRRVMWDYSFKRHKCDDRASKTRSVEPRRLLTGPSSCANLGN